MYFPLFSAGICRLFVIINLAHHIDATAKDMKQQTGKTVESEIIIRLFGESFRFNVDAEKENAREVAGFLEKQVQHTQNELVNHHSTISNLGILLLSALNLAAEHLRLKKEHEQSMNFLLHRSKQLLCVLEEDKEEKDNEEKDEKYTYHPDNLSS